MVWGGFVLQHTLHVIKLILTSPPDCQSWTFSHCEDMDFDPTEPPGVTRPALIGRVLPWPKYALTKSLQFSRITSAGS
eukprot:jgi/Botrbrau1/22434/Bobra.0091s0036.1